MALPGVIVVGAMKCATSALHEYLDSHPDIAMSAPKELNFFNGPERPAGDPGTWWTTGQWHRGLGWYGAQFDADAPVRGESSPAYTSPSFPEVARRMAAVVPEARLVYLVREPVQRALSQYAHHRRDGTEARAAVEAILDPNSQYVARSRYFDRIRPFLDAFDTGQILTVVQERLLHSPMREMTRVFEHVGVDQCRRDLVGERHVRLRHTPRDCEPGLRTAVWDLVRDDVARLEDLLGEEIPEWRAEGPRDPRDRSAR